MSTLYAEPDRHRYLGFNIKDQHHRDIIASVLRAFGLSSGEQVVEIGAGVGRYTSLLVEHGLRVLAMEPDPRMVENLRERFTDRPNVEVLQAYPYDITVFPLNASVVCGFHVLHHMDSAALERLAAVLLQLSHGRSKLKGWFFLEPNPFNLLYPLQVAARPSMRFSEERGIWLNRYTKSLSKAKASVLGYIGYFPPSRWTAKLSPSLQRMGTRAVRLPSLVRAYQLLGCIAEQSKSESTTDGEATR